MRRRAGVRSTQRRNLTMTIVNDPNNRFAGVPVEYDTTILSRAESEIAGIPVLVESSHWDDGNCMETLIFKPAGKEGDSELVESFRLGGFYMDSVVFVSSDIADKDDEAIEALVRASGRVKDDSSMTINRNFEAYTFVNFNFVSGFDLLDPESPAPGS